MYGILDFDYLFRQQPHATATMKGSSAYPGIYGLVFFYQLEEGVIVIAQIGGLPAPSDPCKSPVFGFHIHTGTSCTGNTTDPFADALTHYNPKDCLHPYHAGDLPPLFGNHGYAFSACLTDRFTVDDIIGRTAIIHAMPDDMTTQPSGNSGAKIACGVVKKGM